MVAEGAPSRYDAFVSYSHAADDLLAPRLQAGLQRFAKPWWRRRAVRVFRDESSLSASPHLWGSITEALDSSAWFVLLLSPEAGSSEWVNREIEYWTADRSRAGRVLPVVTDGEFGWVDGDVTGSSVPPALGGVFESEPRWVDLRFAKGETQLDLKNPEFAAAVADVSSAIRGIPKDELESEEVKQHRRTIRTAWAAGILVLGLGVAASIAAVFAFNEQARANENEALALQEAERANQEAERANQNAELANQNAEEAESQRVEAESQKTIAEREATIARSQALVLEAEKALESDPELSLHLALGAIRGFQETGQDTTQAVGVLRRAVANDRVSVVEDWGGPLAIDPTGTLVALRSGNDVVVREITTGAAVLRCQGAVPSGAFFASDGTLFVAEVSAGLRTCDRGRGLVSVFDTVGVFGHPDLEISADSEYAAWVGEETRQVHLFSLGDGASVALSRPSGDGPGFSDDGRLAYTELDRVHQAEARTGALIRTTFLGACCYSRVSWSPDGSRIAVAGDAGVAVIDADSGRIIWSSPGRMSGEGRPVWLETHDLLVVAGEPGFILFDDQSGAIVDIIGDLGQGFGLGVHFLLYQWVPGTTLIAVGGEPGDGKMVVFDASPLSGTEVGGWSSPLSSVSQLRLSEDGSKAFFGDDESTFVVGNSISGDVDRLVRIPSFLESPEGAAVVSVSGLLAHSRGSDRTWVIRDLVSDQTLYETPQDWSVQGLSDDGARALIYDELECVFVVVDVASGSEMSHLDEDCQSGHAPGRRFFFSPLGTYVFGSWEGAVADSLFDVATGSLLGTGFGGGAMAAFLPDESEIVVLTLSGDLSVKEIHDSLPGLRRLRISAHSTEPTSLAVSPDGSMAATSSLGEPLRLWDLSTGLLLGEFGGDPGSSGWHVGAFHPTEPYLLVGSPLGVVRIFTLDLDELIAIAESRLSRDLTEAECLQYTGVCAP